MVATLKLTGILGAVAWAFCFAMSGLFFPLVLGVWWKRANRPGPSPAWWSVSASDRGTCMVKWGGMTPWWGIDDLRFGIVGATASLIAMVVVSLLTKAPDKERRPWSTRSASPRSGKTILASSPH
jgi:cation/acetate symporter